MRSEFRYVSIGSNADTEGGILSYVGRGGEGRTPFIVLAPLVLGYLIYGLLPNPIEFVLLQV